MKERKPPKTEEFRRIGNAGVLWPTKERKMFSNEKTVCPQNAEPNFFGADLHR
jgi:aspartyl/asparaginyl beta-hydroxylase (cupin superfamily)